MAGAGHAASTGTTALHTPQGSGAGLSNGDYVTSVAGLNTFYRYFIEVPPGLNRLVVEVFDPDVGRGGLAEGPGGRDRDRGDGFATMASYGLVRPDGSAPALVSCDALTCTDNAWQAIVDSTTAQDTAAGHWELRVAMGGGNDVNAIGIRAHDGTIGGGGTELNVYYDSHSQFGVNPPAVGHGSRGYKTYPYIVSGCSAAKNDFDFDSEAGDVGAITLTSRTGAFTRGFSSAALSGSGLWRRDTFSGWTSDAVAGEYGVWAADMWISTYGALAINGNCANVWFSNSAAMANPPAANPTANAFRVYLPTDAGTAPSLPYAEQLATWGGCVDNGPNPPAVGLTSCFTVSVRVVNAAAQPITFSPTKLVTATVPGGGTTFAGVTWTSQGTIVSQPAAGGTGSLTWNPGTVAAGTTAQLAYRVLVTPTSPGQRVPLTATPASGSGTRAQYVDHTGNTTQNRATFLLGPLCDLAVREGMPYPGSADLSVALLDAPDPVGGLGSLLYTINVNNAGPSSASGLSVVHTLPAGVTFSSATGTGWTCSAPSTVNCDLASLASGTAAAPLSVEVAVGPAGATLTSGVTVSSSLSDPNASNDTASASTTVNGVSQADLSSSLTIDSATAVWGRPVTYTITVTDSGPDAVTGATVSDSFPAGLLDVSWTCAASTGSTCTAAGSGSINDTGVNLASAGIVIYSATGVVAYGTGSPLVNTATVGSSTHDPIPGNNSSTSSIPVDTDLIFKDGFEGSTQPGV